MARTIHGDHERFLDVYYRPYPGLNNTFSIIPQGYIST